MSDFIEIQKEIQALRAQLKHKEEIIESLFQAYIIVFDRIDAPAGSASSSQWPKHNLGEGKRKFQSAFKLCGKNV